MDVYFESRCPDGDQLRALAVRHTHAATHRIVNPVSWVKVQLSNTTQADNSADKRCRVEFTIGHSGAIVASANAPDWRSALDRALARATGWLPHIQRRLRASFAASGTSG
jgi:hypothetical protein